LGYVDDLQQQEKMAQIKVNQCIQVEEEYWKQKAHINWLTQGA
jgi:hypothetical protein